MTSNATSSWIAQAVANKYHNPDVVRTHVEAALASFIGLRPKMDNFTHDSGESLILMALHGTLPVSFRGVVYNIPVAVWVPLTYPRHPPIAFVTPTANMLVRAGRHVDLAGRVYHPILANWHNMPSADVSLTNLLSALQTVFAAEPPVYAKPAVPIQHQSQPQLSGSRTPPPIPVNPLRQTTQSPQPGYQQQQYSQSPPAIPQKPGGAAALGPAIPPKPNNATSSPNARPQTMSPPPIPPNPLLLQQQQQQQQQLQQQSYTTQNIPAPPPKTLSQPAYTPAPPGQSQYRALSVPPYSNQYQQPVPIVPNGSGSGLPTFLAASPTTSPGFRQYAQFPSQQASSQTQDAYQFTQPQPHQQLQQQQPQPQQIYYQSPQQSYDPSLQQQQQQQINQHQYHQTAPTIDASFTSPQHEQQQQQQQQHPQVQSPQHLITPTTISAASSPSKPTPQELQKRENERRGQELRKVLAGRLIATSQDLEVSKLRDFERIRGLGVAVMEGEVRVRGVLGRLGEEENKVRKNVEILGSKVSDMKAVIEKVKKEPEVQVDEILTSVSVVENQLLDLLAEEHALDDMIYQLTKALNAEKIELAVFMKHTRMLARDLFLKRALIKKIQLHIQMQ